MTTVPKNLKFGIKIKIHLFLDPKFDQINLEFGQLFEHFQMFENSQTFECSAKITL